MGSKEWITEGRTGGGRRAQGPRVKAAADLIMEGVVGTEKVHEF